MIRKVVAVWMMMAFFSSAAGAGWLGDVLLGAASGIGDRAVRDAMETGYERGKASIARRGEPGKEAEHRAGDGAAPEGRSAGARIPGPGTKGTASRTGKRAIAPSEVQSRYDFLPGDRVMFFDDFADTDAGEFPRRWTMKGPDINTWKVPLEVARYDGRKWVRYRPSNDRKDVVSSFYARLNCGKDLPETFTVEFDAVLPPFDGTDQCPEYRVLMINHGGRFRYHDFKSTGSNVVRIGSIGAFAGSTRLDYERGDGQVHRVAIAVNGTSVKAYLDEELVVNDPEGIERPVTLIGMELAYQTGRDLLPLMFTNFRVAAGGKEMKAALATDGRIVTRGIRFETGSDVLLPSSIPTLSAVKKLLEENPGLAFSVEGHTDDQGEAAVNQPLSERRAAAVTSWLEARGIARDRLRTKGWGSTRPAGANDSTEGRANNRRVEFVKIDPTPTPTTSAERPAR
ncbi:MAG: hypothetical protein OHK0028_07530 [Deltaproteobacteria bacterium]